MSSRGTVDGATYTDVNAQLPALNLLVLISLAAAVLFIVNIFRRGWVLPAVAVGLWAFVALVVGGIYPQWVQRFQVQPNESAQERPYIERNIEATRAALDLQDVTVQPFRLRTNAEDVEPARRPSPRSATSACGTRPASLSGQTFEPLQRIRDYYSIHDIDVDRYADRRRDHAGQHRRPHDQPGRRAGRLVGGRPPRLHPRLRGGAGAVERLARTTSPSSCIGDIPLRDRRRARPTSTSPSIYFGEDLGGYVMVDTDRDEIDYQDEDEHRVRRATRATTACRPGRWCGGRRSPCASATSTRSSPTSSPTTRR